MILLYIFAARHVYSSLLAHVQDMLVKMSHFHSVHTLSSYSVMIFGSKLLFQQFCAKSIISKLIDFFLTYFSYLLVLLINDF